MGEDAERKNRWCSNYYGANKQDIRNKVATNSRAVKQVATASKSMMYSGSYRLHRHLIVPLGILLRNTLCQDVVVV